MRFSVAWRRAGTVWYPCCKTVSRLIGPTLPSGVPQNDHMTEPSAQPVDVSVIVPCFNTAPYVCETLDSVLAQSYGGTVEIIVINDGSPDTPDLERVIAPFGDRIRYIAQENRGLAGARNTGIRAARGRYVAFLDSDDAWLPNYLELMVRTLEEEPTAAAAFPDVVIFGGGSEDGRIPRVPGARQDAITFESFVSGRSWISAGATVRRDVVVRHGMFDETFRQVEDFELWLRMLHAGERIEYVPEVLIRYRRWEGSLSANHRKMFDTQLRVLHKAMSTLDLTAGQRASVESRVHRIHVEAKLQQGREAFLRRDFRLARRILSEANASIRHRKLSLVILVLGLAPGLLHWVHSARLRS